MRASIQWAVLAVFTAVVVALAYLAIRVQTDDITPSDRVQNASEISEHHHQLLIAEGLLRNGEAVEYFYSEGENSVKEGGSILTDRRVIAYSQGGDGRIASWQIPNEDIASVSKSEESGDEDHIVYRVADAEDDWIELWLPNQHGDAERFANAVRAKIVN